MYVFLKVRAVVDDGDLRVGSSEWEGSLSIHGGNGVSLTGDSVNITSYSNLQLTTLTVRLITTDSDLLANTVEPL